MDKNTKGPAPGPKSEWETTRVGSAEVVHVGVPKGTPKDKVHVVLDGGGAPGDEEAWVAIRRLRFLARANGACPHLVGERLPGLCGPTGYLDRYPEYQARWESHEWRAVSGSDAEGRPFFMIVPPKGEEPAGFNLPVFFQRYLGHPLVVCMYPPPGCPATFSSSKFDVKVVGRSFYHLLRG